MRQVRMVAVGTRTVPWMLLLSLLHGRLVLLTLARSHLSTRNPLQQQSELARASATNPRHVKLKHMCAQCHGQILSVRSHCRFSGAANRTPRTTPCISNLTHPTNLASQLLATAPTQLARFVPKDLKREGRSPTVKRRLPPRGGLHLHQPATWCIQVTGKALHRQVQGADVVPCRPGNLSTRRSLCHPALAALPLTHDSRNKK